jgi:hypothetical protein
VSPQKHCLKHFNFAFPRTLIKGSNVIRAAKIALARLGKDNDVDLFAAASGHGVERVHKISSSKLSETIERFVLSHPASVLLPPPRNL